MKNKIKYSILCIIIFLIVIGSINLYEPYSEEKVRGQIQIWVKANTYDYMLNCAQTFMENNNKVNIVVNVIENGDIKIDEDNEDKNTIYMFEMSNEDFYNRKLDQKWNYYNTNDIFFTYSNNFPSHIVDSYDKYKKGIPFTTRPLALYVDENILDQYGYSKYDFNTWDDLIRIGKDINEKSEGKIKTLNATDEDYKDLMDLLIMQNMSSDLEKEEIEGKIKNEINLMKSDNLLNYDREGSYICKISSIEGIKNIIDSEHVWSLTTVPSYRGGENKFFSAEGSELFTIDNENRNLTQKFIVYLITNHKNVIPYMNEGLFFPSYLYTYRKAEIDKEVQYIEGQSPLSTFSNIEEKSIAITNYDIYIDIKNELEN